MPEGPAKFPEWFVPDCPPEDASDASGTVYRFVTEKSIDPEEFRSYHETGERPNGQACQRCGMSVYRKAAEVRSLLRHLWKNYPGRNYGPHLVKRLLAPSDGKIKATGAQGHHTWWAYDGVERHQSFQFIETVTRG